MAYPDGTLDQLRAWYEPSWGRLGARVHPVPGNHDFHTGPAPRATSTSSTAPARRPGASATGGAAGTASTSAVGTSWRSTRTARRSAAAGPAPRRRLGCAPTWPPTGQACTLAFWHTPRFSSGPHSDQPLVAPLWFALQEAGAELVLSGHDHHYERFAPQNAWGAADPRGLRQFIAGTGGKGTRPLVRVAPNSEARDDASLGALLLTLRPGGYDWRFAAAVGTYADAGSGSCH
jgi:hypothetical protein